MNPKQSSSIEAFLLRWCFCIGLVLFPRLEVRALIMMTNCPDFAESIPAPKRIQSNCGGFFDSPLFALPEGIILSDGGFYSKYMQAGGQGTGRMLPDGTATWNVTVPSGGISDLSPVNENRFLAFQQRFIEEKIVTSFGLYDRVGNSLEPVFETDLPYEDDFSLEVMEDGTIIFVFDRLNSLALLAFSLDGALLWGREFTSLELSVSRSMLTFPVGTNEFLILLSSTETVDSATGVKALVTRFDSDGNLLWGRKLHVPVNQGASARPNFHLIAKNEILLSISDFSLDQSANLKQWMTYVKLDSRGEFQWGRRVEDVTFASVPFAIDHQGSILVPLNAVGPGSISSIFNAEGEIASSVLVTPTSGYLTPIAASQTSRKVYYTGLSDADPSDNKSKALIASSSLDLENFEGFKYLSSDVSGSALGLLQDDRLVFIGYAGSKGADFLLLSSDLDLESDCSLFDEIAVTATPISLENSAYEVAVFDIVFESAALSFTPIPAELIMEAVSFNEESLCNTPTAPSVSATLMDNQIVLSWSGSATDYRLEYKLNLENGIWNAVSPAPILQEGKFVFTESTSTPGTKFFRLVQP